MPMPKQMTVCLRTFHYTFVFPKSAYAFAFFFGSLLPVKIMIMILVIQDSDVTCWNIMSRIGATWTKAGFMGSGRPGLGGHFMTRFSNSSFQLFGKQAFRLDEWLGGWKMVGDISFQKMCGLMG